MKLTRGTMLVIVGLFIAPIAITITARAAKPAAGPTMENLMAAEEGLAKAFRENNADGIQSYLSDDWAVISGFADVAEGNDTFSSGIKSGSRTLKTFDISEPRARLNGNTGWVTFTLHLAGQSRGKPFDVMERETDIWTWKDGNWKCTLSHEVVFPKDEKPYLDDKQFMDKYKDQK
jgi:ketosteroid isomerase-like protein